LAASLPAKSKQFAKEFLRKPLGLLQSLLGALQNLLQAKGVFLTVITHQLLLSFKQRFKKGKFHVRCNNLRS
jgi:hypothetical protein